MSEVLKFIKKYKKEAVLAPLLKMSEALLELFVPLVVSSVIDIGIGSADSSFIIKRALILLLLAVAGFAFSSTAQYMSAKAAVGTSTDLKAALFSHIQKLSYSKLDTVGTSTLIARMTSDVNQVQSGINLTLRLFLRSPFIVFGAMIMAFTLDFKSALIFAATILILSVIVFSIISVTIPKHKTVQKKLDGVLLSIRENLSGVRVLRAFNKEEDEEKSFDEKNTLLYHAQCTVGRISALMNPLTLVTVNIATVVLIYTGAVKVGKGELSAGTVVALYNYMAQILVELVKLANLIVNITKSIANANRIADVFKTEAEQVESSNDSAEFSNGDIVFNNVSFSYDGASCESLSGISFKVKKGSTVGIIGGTGSGKSTLVNLIPKFYHAQKGEITVNGVSVENITASSLRRNIGIVPQKAVLFKGSIRDNLLMGNEEADDSLLEEALKQSQSYDFVSQKEGYLDFELEQGGKNLSGGQKQRLTIARALVKKPSVLILDDSASALDLATDARLRKNIAELDYKPTTFIVSQRAASVMGCDTILVLDDGELSGVGTHKELLESCPVYSEIYNSQFKKEAQNG